MGAGVELHRGSDAANPWSVRVYVGAFPTLEAATAARDAALDKLGLLDRYEG